MIDKEASVAKTNGANGSNGHQKGDMDIDEEL